MQKARYLRNKTFLYLDKDSLFSFKKRAYKTRGLSNVKEEYMIWIENLPLYLFMIISLNLHYTSRDFKTKNDIASEKKEISNDDDAIASIREFAKDFT
ncbi:hypothetical protein BpHYR1_037063 [Brachionus plicatilis]|uniref:Uncharacterized protein n=1 Tax=Brachionus plicatilis TaxID=10195 RepID=A0A3M7QJ06_BRAPC|nr:hypothetical protein BpHYR1_037063 [Brachionus plicatilis]